MSAMAVPCSRKGKTDRVLSLVLLLIRFENAFGGERPPASIKKGPWMLTSELNVVYGTVVEMKIDGSLWIGFSPFELATVAKFPNEKFAKFHSADPRLLTDPKWFTARKVEVPFETFNWQANKAVALMRQLKKLKNLPYGRWFCNEKHYMNYIIYTTVHDPFLNRVCPLRRDIKGMSVSQIEDKGFYLISSCKLWKPQRVYPTPPKTPQGETRR